MSADAAEALIEAGELDEARAMYERPVGGGRRQPADARHHRHARGGSTCATSPRAGTHPVAATVEAAIATLEAASDHAGLARAWRILTNIHFASCAYSDATTSAERMIDEARRAGDRPMELRARPSRRAPTRPTPVPEAIAIVEGVLAELEGDRKAEAYTQRALANLKAMRGRDRGGASVVPGEPGDPRRPRRRFDAALTSAIASGPMELIAGDPVSAERELRRDHEALSAMGERNYISTTKAFLAEALYRQERDEEALAMTRESDRGRRRRRDAVPVAQRARKVVARAGDHAAAEQALSRLHRHHRGHPGLRLQGYAWMDFAQVLQMAGRAHEATEAARTAQARFRTKGNVESEAARWPRRACRDEGGALARERRDLLGHGPGGPAHAEQPLELRCHAGSRAVRSRKRSTVSTHASSESATTSAVRTSEPRNANSPKVMPADSVERRQAWPSSDSTDTESVPRSPGTGSRAGSPRRTTRSPAVHRRGSRTVAGSQLDRAHALDRLVVDQRDRLGRDVHVGAAECHVLGPLECRVQLVEPRQGLGPCSARTVHASTPSACSPMSDHASPSPSRDDKPAARSAGSGAMSGSNPVTRRGPG